MVPGSGCHVRSSSFQVRWFELRTWNVELWNLELWNPSRSPYSHQPLARGQVAKQQLIERLGGVRQHVVHAHLRELRLQRLDMTPNEAAVLVAERLRHHRHLLARFEILEARRVFESEIELRGIEHVEHDQIVAEKMQRLQGFEN